MPRMTHTFFACQKISWEPDPKSFSRLWKRGIIQMPMTYGDLSEMLLSIGGDAVVPAREDGDDFNRAVMRRGQFFRSGAFMANMKACDCHGNVSRLYLEGYPLWIATGYALSNDGLWRSHTWGVSRKDGEVVETTEPRVAYYGFVMPKRLSDEFARDNA